MNYYLDVWRGYFDFSGRARRKEYWYFTLLHTAMEIVGVLLIAGLSKDRPAIGTAFEILVILYILASIIPSIAVTVRRLHDIDKSGWWYFICFIPFVGPFWALFLALTDGTDGPNQYGPDPKAAQAKMQLLPEPRAPL